MQTARRALFNRSLVAGLLASATLLMPSLSHAEDSLHLDLNEVMPQIDWRDLLGI